ncbi:DUF4124 domain-containing protein [Pseudomonas sp. NBRC 111135]|uniref:DUF4124 domain-containing protein n=1 Tax=Pseudomonas sp. NBRC 111135 TaxID=1661050 RepID=UPI0006D4506F|nr:DUF4124 domain-containing protein [Pseudomonas sp. NBRC 111135]
MRHFAAVAAICLISSAAQAAAVFKCVDEKGKVTFTANANCPTGNDLTDVVSAHNAAPSGSGPAAVMAKPERHRPRYHSSGSSAPQSQGYTVVGGSADNAPCTTGLSDRDLRTAMVRKEVVPGMSRDQIEQMYGKPNRDGSARGAGTTSYWNDKYVDVTSVSYDSGGCVRTSQQSGHKN